MSASKKELSDLGFTVFRQTDAAIDQLADAINSADLLVGWSDEKEQTEARKVAESLKKARRELDAARARLTKIAARLA